MSKKDISEKNITSIVQGIKEGNHQNDDLWKRLNEAVLNSTSNDISSIIFYSFDNNQIENFIKIADELRCIRDLENGADFSHD